MAAILDNPRATGAGHAYSARLEAVSPDPHIASIANSLARTALFPDDVQALLDGIREGLLINKHLKLHQSIGESLAELADWIGKEAV